jgi:phosphoglycolate phosphatase
MGQVPWSYEETRTRARRSLRDSFPGLFGTRWEEARDAFYSHFAAHHMQALQPLAGAAELLQTLHQADCPMGVVSNKSGPFLRAEVAALGWQHYFRRVVGAQDAEADKPHPACVGLVLASAGLQAGPEVWLVGDTALDMECARAAGCTPVLVGTPVDDLSAHPPAHHARDLAALRHLITNFWAGLVTDGPLT